MGGSSSPAPVQQNVNNTQIPDYLAPYASNMLNATQAQIFNPTTNPDGTTSYSSFKPYQPYSTNPSDYFAAFSPMQQQAQSTVANLQNPNQYNQAIGVTGQDIMKSGMVGNRMGQAGNQYAQQATDPNSIAAYMNPYLQQSLAPQLQLLGQQTGMQTAGEQAAATSKGAFGGSREALANSLQQQQGNLAAQQAIGQGYNQAFGNAQQAQQFGANLGLQGQQAQLGAINQQMTGANQLAGLGGQQLASQENIANLQNQLGAQQTQAQQNIINQAVQNYATAQQYPFMQLGVMNAMLRGLPTQQTSTTMYQAPPSTVSQLGGLGLAGLGGLGMYNAATGSKRGGKVKAMATGGAVPMTMMNDQQLQQVQQSPASSPMAKMYAQDLNQMHGYIHNNPEASKVMSQPLQGSIPSGGMPPPQQVAMAPQTRTGVAAIGTGDMTKMASGGILAFAVGGDKGKLLSDVDADEKMFRDYLTNNLAELQSGKGSVTEAYKPLAEEQKADIAQQKSMILPEFAFRTGIGMMSGAGDRTGGTFGNLLSSVGTSALGAESGMQKSLADINAAKKLMQAGTLEAAKQDQARRDAAGITAAQMLGNINAKKVGMASAEAQKEMAAATRGAGIAQANALKESALTEKGQNAFSGLVEKYTKDLLSNEIKRYKYDANPLLLKADAYNYAYMDLAPTYRDKLGLPTPAEYSKNLGLTPPGATSVTPTQTSPIINPPKVNSAIPSVPKAQLRWDPEKMTTVPY
jgi:hypothetical protein